MRNFTRLIHGIDVTAIMLELKQNESLWNSLPLRTGYDGSSQREVDDIVLRFSDLNTYPDRDSLVQIFNDKEVVWHPSIFAFPAVRQLALQVMHRVEGESLGRVVISRLAMGKQVYPHIDEGEYADHYDRFHVCLQSDSGSVFMDGEDSCYMAAGELWWFNRKSMHGVENRGVSDRIHIIIDVRLYNPGQIKMQRIPA